MSRLAFFPTPEEFQTLSESGLFLPAWYSDRYGTGTDNPLMEFFRTGCAAGRAPNPYFDCTWYMQAHSDVRSAGMNPLLHYLLYGDREGRRPIAFFDPLWYRKAFTVPESETSLGHFLRYRLDGTVRPVPEFDPIRYLRLHPDVAQRGQDPFLCWQTGQADAPLDDYGIISVSGLFDPTFYLVTNPDVRAQDLDPLAHFCAYGWHEGRNPNLYFQLDWYISHYLSERRNETNVLCHYYLEGETQDMQPSRHFQPRWYAQTYGLPKWQSALGHYLAHRRTQIFSPNPAFDITHYLQRHAAEIGPNRDAFAHYLRRYGRPETTNEGSAQKCGVRQVG
jgi:hypothetical protein